MNLQTLAAGRIDWGTCCRWDARFRPGLMKMCVVPARIGRSRRGPKVTLAGLTVIHVNVGRSWICRLFLSFVTFREDLGKLLMRCRNHQCRHDTGTMDWIGRSGHALGNTDLKKWWSEGTKGTGIFFIGIYRYLIDILSLFYRYRYLIGIWSVLIRYLSVIYRYTYFIGFLSGVYQYPIGLGILSVFHRHFMSSIELGCSILVVTWLRHDSNI